MQDFRKLDVFQRGLGLTSAVYRATRSFPKSETYALSSQMRRAAASIPSNVAEGCSRRASAELARFLEIALGSANELEAQTLLVGELGYLSSEREEALMAEIGAVQGMLIRLRARVLAPQTQIQEPK